MPAKARGKKTLGITSPDDDKLGKRSPPRSSCLFPPPGKWFFFILYPLSISLIGIGWTLLANPNELLMDLRSLRRIQTLCTFAMVWNQWLRRLRHLSLEEVQVRLASCPGSPWSRRLHCVAWTAVFNISSAAHDTYYNAALWTQAWLVLVWIPDLFWGGPGG